MSDASAGPWTPSPIGIRLLAERDEPSLYTIRLCNDVDRPILDSHGYVVVFTDPADAAAAMRLDPHAGDCPAPSAELDMVCDIPAALYLLSQADGDDQAVILNCLNTMFDCVAAIGTPAPAAYQRTLFGLADRLTFHREFASYCRESSLTRDEILDAFYWYLGAILAKTRLFVPVQA